MAEPLYKPLSPELEILRQKILNDVRNEIENMFNHLVPQSIPCVHCGTIVHRQRTNEILGFVQTFPCPRCQAHMPMDYDYCYKCGGALKQGRRRIFE